MNIKNGYLLDAKVLHKKLKIKTAFSQWCNERVQQLKLKPSMYIRYVGASASGQRTIGMLITQEAVDLITAHWVKRQNQLKYAAFKREKELEAMTAMEATAERAAQLKKY